MRVYTQGIRRGPFPGIAVILTLWGVLRCLVWLFFRASHFVWSRAIIAFLVGLVSWIIAVTYRIRLGFGCVTVVSSEERGSAPPRNGCGVAPGVEHHEVEHEGVRAG
jgi:hypothetical protein